VLEAQTEADALTVEAEYTSEEFTRAAARFLTAVEQAELAAVDLAAARAGASSAILRLTDLSSQFGLNAPVPDMPALPPTEAKMAYLRGLVVSQVAYGEPDEVTLRDLADARTELGPGATG
jgi:hypothetical protein